MDQQLSAVIRRLPQSRAAILELAIRDRTFRSLCADLAAADKALQQWEASLLAADVERSIEYRLMISGLIAEVEAALDHSHNGRF